MANLKELFLLKRERETYKIYFKKYFKIKDRDGEQKIIPFVTNPSQDKLINIVQEWDKGKDKRTLFVIILKARKEGFSTCTEAIFLKKLLHEKNKVAMIVSYDDKSATYINSMADLLYQHLPVEAKPERRLSRGNGIILENPKYDPNLPTSETNDPGLQSSFFVETANNVHAGSAFTINYLHISEYGKCTGDVKTMMASLLNAVPTTNSIVIIESTAEGYNHFKDLWDSSVAYVMKNGKRTKKNAYIALFIAWFEDKGYVLPYTGFKLTDYEDPIYGNEVVLKKLHNLSNDQLEWRRFHIDNKCEGDLDIFHQEMPSTAKEAFIATGKSVFNKKLLDDRIETLKKYYETHETRLGRFEFKFNKDKSIDDTSITFIDDENGYITIYTEPQKGYPYVIGGDTAGEGSDYFAAHVVNNVDGKQSAVLHTHMGSDIFAYQMYCLGKYYNNALIAIEMNFDYTPNDILDKLNYWNLYRRERIDTMFEETEKKYGFRTTSITRPVIINNLITVVRETINDVIYDIETLNEMFTFVYNKARKPIAESGKHDDLVISAAIAYYCRNQMITDVEELEQEQEEYDEDDINPNAENWMAD